MSHCHGHSGHGHHHHGVHHGLHHTGGHHEHHHTGGHHRHHCDMGMTMALANLLATRIMEGGVCSPPGKCNHCC